jgi:N-acetylglucosamine kinase-like BadF-type ATPase
VTSALRAYDSGSNNGLLPVIAQSWKVAPEEVIRMANAAEPRFAELAGAITEAAEKGEATARDIAARAGKALAALGAAVILRLWPEDGVVPVALAGGVLQGSALVRHAFRDEMRALHPQAAISFAQVRTVLGALEIAAQRGKR